MFTSSLVSCSQRQLFFVVLFFFLFSLLVCSSHVVSCRVVQEKCNGGRGGAQDEEGVQQQAAPAPPNDCRGPSRRQVRGFPQGNPRQNRLPLQGDLKQRKNLLVCLFVAIVECFFEIHFSFVPVQFVLVAGVVSLCVCSYLFSRCLSFVMASHGVLCLCR
jgi:hypothetical protein